MKTVPSLVLAIILCAAIGTAGCFLLDERKATTVPPTPAPVTVVTITPAGPQLREASGLALQLTDLPSGYIIQERSDLAYSDISPFSREQGWNAGYFASFYRLNAEKYDITAISQRIGIYTVKNPHLVDNTMGPVFDAAEADLLSAANESVTVTELPFPRTGDESSAFRITAANNQYGIIRYVVLFRKADVMESVEMRGTTTDYEALKTIVGNAARKI